MIDKSKRQTLKLLTTAGTLGAVACLPTPVLAGIKELATESTAAATHYGVSELTILINDNGTAEFTNLAAKPLELKHFFPGSVYWENNFLDLNTLRNSSAQVLEANASLVLPVQVRKNQAMNCTSDCLWADAALPRRQSSVETRSVLIGAYQHHGQLHTYPIPDVIAGGFS